jgi:hypothetical protein
VDGNGNVLNWNYPPQTKIRVRKVTESFISAQFPTGIGIIADIDLRL